MYRVNSESQLLILDEPTNDLDIVTLNFRVSCLIILVVYRSITRSLLMDKIVDLIYFRGQG
jgi:ABC-type cobalamin transport system ATPase subunit